MSDIVNEDPYLMASSYKTDVYEERNHNGRIANYLFLSTSQTKAILELALPRRSVLNLPANRASKNKLLF
jgi:prepilin-type processing-associated H-X9-DG protein